jgi:ABC-type iron transport system FetAB ATPase subunit
VCRQAVQDSLLQTLKETAERLGQNRSLLLIGPSGCGKTLVSGLHQLACSPTIGTLFSVFLCDACWPLDWLCIALH